MNMKSLRYTLCLCFCLFFQTVYGQYDILGEYNQVINQEQYMLDSMDGQTDGKITVGNIEVSERATRLYLTQIDSLQSWIAKDSTRKMYQKRSHLRDIKYWILSPNTNNYTTKDELDRIEVLYNLDQNTNQHISKRILSENTGVALALYKKYQDEDFAYDALKNLLAKNPTLFAQNLHYFGSSQNVNSLIDDMVKKNPIAMKRWVGTATPMGNTLATSPNTLTRNFVNIYNEFGRVSRAYYMLDEINRGVLTPAQAHAIGSDDRKFREKLIDLAIDDNIIGSEAIHDELGQQSLKVVRAINDLHNEKDPKKRFAAVDALSAEDFYTMMVYTPEEIFTSTYNGFYERFLKKLGDKDAYDFLHEMNLNKYRTFIRMAAGYNKLNDFLDHMSDDKKKLLLNTFVSELEQGGVSESLAAAVDVADTFGSLDDKDLQTFFSSKISSELARVNSYYDQHGIRIYSLLNVLLAQGSTFSESWITDLVSRYDIPAIDLLKFESLKDHEGKIVEHVFFYDDDDGKASYASFMPSFRNSTWKIEDKSTFVKMTSTTAQKVVVYANKPQFEYEGKADIRKHLFKTGERPSVVIHRGHSFYVDTTITGMTNSAKLVILGSCGGYHNLTKVLERSPDVQIISSKQIGSMSINDPMIRQLNGNLVKGQDLDWRDFWDKLGRKLKGNSATYKKFEDYVPPHQNLGAIFIMAYSKMRVQDEGRGLVISL